VPLSPDAAWLARVQGELPVLPAQRRATLAEAAGVEATTYSVAVIVERGLDALALAAIAAGGDAGRVLVHVEHDLAVEGADQLNPAALGALTRMETDGKLTATQAKVVLADLVAAGDGDPTAIAAAKGFEVMDTSTLEAAVDTAIAANQSAFDKWCRGEDKAMGAVVGAVMKATQGKADGKVVTAILQQRRVAAG